MHSVAVVVSVARRAHLSMGFSRQEYPSGLPGPLPGDLPDREIEPASLTSPAWAGGFFTTSTTWEAMICHSVYHEITACLSACLPARPRRRVSEAGGGT